MLTVLLATRDGAKTLPRVFEAFTQLHEPEGGWKLVIIDNGSTDRTRQIVASFQERLPLRYRYEAMPGKNAALNSALDSISGDLAVFTDDDVIPDADWLVRIREASDAHTECSIFGGRILPQWEGAPPSRLAWIPAGAVFALTDPTLMAGPAMASNIFGPNMAVRSSVFAVGVRFDPLMGPIGIRCAMGSETELVRRLIRQGHQAWHIPAATVRHVIREYQTEESWILRRAIRFGRGQYRMLQGEGPLNCARWMGIPRYLFRKMLVHGLHIAKAYSTLNRRGVFEARWDFNYTLGQILEARLLRRPSPLSAPIEDRG